jgi:hypothetical protein
MFGYSVARFINHLTYLVISLLGLLPAVHGSERFAWVQRLISRRWAVLVARQIGSVILSGAAAIVRYRVVKK